MADLEVPAGMGLIVRTAGVGKESTELKWDLKVLQHHWAAITEAAQTKGAPFLIHQESNVIVRAIRDYLRRDVGEILIDHPRIYEEAKQHIALVRPDFVERVKLYEAEVPLFTHYQIESQIESAFQREVRLPSGGSIVIDPTEALTSIDINSARATKGGDIEETALNTNLEAADEIARQLRLRDLGGLVVIDFIDMTPVRHQREVENRLRDAVHHDRARVQLGRISRFGLMEMSRQRLRPSLEESAAHICPRCHGQGTIRSTESLALSILRLMEEEAIKENTSQIEAIVPVDVAAFLLNEKRKAIRITEQRHDVEVYVIPDPHMMTPDYRVIRHRTDDEIDESSYKRIEQPEAKLYEPRKLERTAAPAPALKGFTAPQKVEQDVAPVAKVEAAKPGLFSKLFSAIGSFFSSSDNAATEKSAETKKSDSQATNANRRNRRNDTRRTRNNQDTEKAKEGSREPRARNAKKVADAPQAQERPIREKDESAKRAKPEAKNRSQAPKEVIADVQDEAPKQEVVRERRQRRNMRRKVRMDNTTDVVETSIQEEAILAEIVAINADAAVEAQPEAKAPRSRRQPRKEVAVANETTDTPATDAADEAKPIDAIADAPIVESQADIQVDPKSEAQLATTDEDNTDVDDKTKRESRDGQRRSRRSPRHLRAAGQRRRRDEDEQSTAAPAQFIPNDALGEDQDYPAPMAIVETVNFADQAVAETVAVEVEVKSVATQPTTVAHTADVTTSYEATFSESKAIDDATSAVAVEQLTDIKADVVDTEIASEPVVNDNATQTVKVSNVIAESSVVIEPTVQTTVVAQTDVRTFDAKAEEVTQATEKAELKEVVKSVASAPMAKPAAIVKPQVKPVVAQASAVQPSEAVVSKPKAASRFGAMVSSEMTKPTVEVRAQVEVPKGREYENTPASEAATKLKHSNSAESDMARP